MGLIDYITKALRREQTEQDRAYTAATIRTSDELSNVRVSQNPKDFARVGRCLQGSVYNAATIVAKAASNGELRLYKKANGMNRSTKSKKVDRKTAAFLCGNNREIRPHNKAVMMAREAEEIQQVTEHEVLDLLRDPDPNTTQSDFMMMLYWYREVTGKAYVWVGGEKPVGLFLLHPQYTHPILKKESGIESYMYGRDNLSPIVIPSSEVLMTRYMIDPFSPWDGVSWVHSIEHYADVENAAVVSEVARWRNSGQYGMILKAPQSYNDVQLKQLEASLRGKGGPLAAGRALIVRDLEVVEAGNKPNEMNYLSGVEQAERAIYRAAGVPEALWKLNDANLASAAAADPFWQRNVYDRQQKVAQDLTEWLLPMFGIERGEMWFAYDNPVLDDVEMETKKMETAFKNGAVYLNEYRKAIGLDPLPDEMNTLGPKQAEQQAAPAEQSSQDQATGQKQPGNQAALSGIKVAELIRLANAVASGVVPEQTAELIARASFPNIPPEQIDQIFSKIQEGDATEIDPDVLLNQQEPIESEQSVGSTKSQTERRPPKAAQAEARRALEWRKEHNRGGTAVGVARARDIANGANLSDSTIMRMVSYFARHEVDKQGQGWSPGEEGYPSAGRIAWGLWGGDAGRTFANAEAERIKRNRKSMDERFVQKDCGTGAGGFKEGNTCARGGSGSSVGSSKGKWKKGQIVKTEFATPYLQARDEEKASGVGFPGDEWNKLRKLQVQSSITKAAEEKKLIQFYQRNGSGFLAGKKHVEILDDPAIKALGLKDYDWINKEQDRRDRASDSNIETNDAEEDAIKHNEKLRPKLRERLIKFVEKAKIKPGTTIYRGINLKDSELKKMIKSGRVPHKELNSWTVSLDVTNEFSGNGPTLRLRNPSTGFVNNWNQDEFEIIKAPKEYKILGVSRTKNGSYLIDVSE